MRHNITDHVALDSGTLHVDVPSTVTVNDDQVDVSYKSASGQTVYVAASLELLRQR